MFSKSLMITGSVFVTAPPDKSEQRETPADCIAPVPIIRPLANALRVFTAQFRPRDPGTDPCRGPSCALLALPCTRLCAESCYRGLSIRLMPRRFAVLTKRSTLYPAIAHRSTSSQSRASLVVGESEANSDRL